MSEQHGVSGAITHIRSSEVNRKKPNSTMWGLLCGSGFQPRVSHSHRVVAVYRGWKPTPINDIITQ